MSDLETSEWSLKDIYEQYRNLMQAQKDAAFVVFSGDICREAGMRTTAQEFTRETFGGLPAYISLGNHDLVPEHERGEAVYEELFGPTRYAFVEGNVLFIVLPMMYGDAQPSYSLEEIAGYVRCLLDSWLKGAPVFFITHYYYPYFDRTAFFAPDTDYAFDLSPWKISGMAYGHTHYYLCLPDLPVPFYNDGQSRCGGGGNMPGATRLFHVDADGNITTELVESGVTESHNGPVLHALCDGAGRLTVTAFDSDGLCEAVSAEVADGQALSLKRINTWLWKADIDTAPTTPFKIAAHFHHGLEARELATECVPRAESVLLKLEKAICLPGNKALFGTPTVEGKRVYVALADEDNSRLGGVCAVDAEDGEILWKFTTGLSVRNSVAIDHGMLYFVDADNTLYKLNAVDGALVWRNPCPSDDLAMTCHNSIALGEGKVFTGCSSLLRAVDQQTGETVWTFRKSMEEFGTTQAPLYHDGRVFFDANWGFGLFALNAKDGKELWDSRPQETGGFHFQPTFSILPDGNVLRAEGERGLTIFNAMTGEILKQMEKPERLFTSSAPLVCNGMAYCGADLCGVLAVDLATLERKWDAKNHVRKALVGTVQYRGQMTTAEASPIMVGDKLLAAACDGFLYFFDPQSGTCLDSFEVGSPLLGSPKYAGGKIYVTDYAGRLLIFQMKE